MQTMRFSTAVDKLRIILFEVGGRREEINYITCKMNKKFDRRLGL